jgi:hypothetical protein
MLVLTDFVVPRNMTTDRRMKRIPRSGTSRKHGGGPEADIRFILKSVVIFPGTTKSVRIRDDEYVVDAQKADSVSVPVIS